MENRLNIKEWADKRDLELRVSIDKYIADGIDKISAVKMATKETTLGPGYIAQIKHDYGWSIFDK